MPRYKEMSNDVLRQRYLAGQSTLTLAEAFGCSPTTIAKRLHAIGVVLRPSRFNPRDVPEGELRRLYHVERFPVEQIAAYFGVSTSTISNKRHLYNIPARPRRKK